MPCTPSNSSSPCIHVHPLCLLFLAHVALFSPIHDSPKDLPKRRQLSVIPSPSVSQPPLLTPSLPTPFLLEEKHLFLHCNNIVSHSVHRTPSPHLSLSVSLLTLPPPSSLPMYSPQANPSLLPLPTSCERNRQANPCTYRQDHT